MPRLRLQGTLAGVFADSAKRVLSVVAPCGGAPNPNPKACASCLPDGKDWALTDASVDCPTKANSCAACDKTKVTPLYCQQLCTQMGQFRYAGVEAGAQCFCGDDISPKTASDPKNNNAKCSGDASQMCGGNNVIAIYEIACAHAGHAPDSVDEEGSGWGSGFIVLLLLGFVFYAGGGTAYNMRMQGLPFKQALPHQHFWRNAYGLIADGVTFSRARAQGVEGGAGRPPGGEKGSFSTEGAGDDGEYFSAAHLSPSSSDEPDWQRGARGSSSSNSPGDSPDGTPKRSKKKKKPRKKSPGGKKVSRRLLEEEGRRDDEVGGLE